MANRNYAELINLAAELANGEGLPTYPEGEFYATTPERERRRILKAMVDVGCGPSRTDSLNSTTVAIMSEGFAFACWLRLNFPPPYPPRHRWREIADFWRNDDRHRWWCWACRDFHVNVC